MEKVFFSIILFFLFSQMQSMAQIQASKPLPISELVGSHSFPIEPENLSFNFSLKLPNENNVTIDSLDVLNQPIKETLFQLAKLSKISVFVSQDVDGPISISLNGLKTEEAFNFLFKMYNLEFSRDQNVLRIFLEKNTPQYQQVFYFRNVPAEKAKPAVENH